MSEESAPDVKPQLRAIFKKRKQKRTPRKRTSRNDGSSSSSPKAKKARKTLEEKHRETPSDSEGEQEEEEEEEEENAPKLSFKIGDKVRTSEMSNKLYENKLGIIIPRGNDGAFGGKGGVVSKDRVVVRFDDLDLGVKAIRIRCLLKEEEKVVNGYRSSGNIVPEGDLGVTVEPKERKKDEDDHIEYEEGIYKGAKFYTDHNPTQRPKSKFHQFGPIAADHTITKTNMIDYNPSICKDYKETGYCGYGDSCKFLHDRTDYKAGWQIDREWEELQKMKKLAEFAKKEGGDEGEYYVGSDDDEDDDLPFACSICRGDFVKPVKTKCNHYFCEKCAFKVHRKTSRCRICKKPTQGIFNSAHDLEKKITFKKKLLAKNTSDVPKATSESGWTYRT